MRCPLTPREFEVLKLGMNGLTYVQTAQELFLSLSTVRTYWHRIRGKLEARSRGDAIVIAVRHGWLGQHPAGSGLPIVIFTERPQSLKMTDGQRLLTRAFDEMLAERTEESIRAYAAVSATARWEVAADGFTVAPSRPYAPLDAMFLRVARAIGGWKPVHNRSAPFGDRSLVTDVPEAA